jgi:lipoprotein-anchoring transpeptidase ErfK/SrfK
VRSRTFIAIGVALATLLLLAGGVYAYDASRAPLIAEGVTVAGLHVGGLEPAQAQARLERSFLARIEEPIVVRRGKRTWKLGPKEARIQANISAMVARAVEVSDEGNILERSFRRLTNGEIDQSLEPEVTYSKAAVVRLMDRIRRSVERDPVNAEVDISSSGVTTKPGRTGRALLASRLHRDIREAIASPSADRRFKAQVRKVQPKVRRKDLVEKYPVVLIANRSSFRLHVYKDLALAKTYPIAVGKAGNETPAGEYTIANKAVNPAWTVPDSDWAGDLRGKVIPGGAPDNPLKSRWLGIYDGVGIHGTSDRASIGSNASHGCLRMLVEDVEDLYPQVPVGAPVYIA